jgi:hypothetical protein
MTQPEVKVFKLFDQAVIIPSDVYLAGIEYVDFKIFSGSRLLITLFIKSIDPLTTVTFDVLNTFTLDDTQFYDNVLTFSADTVGYTKRVLTDFNKFFKLKMTVVGGDVELAVAVSVFDNAMTTRIENAEIDVHLTDKQTSFRVYDSVRIGDGQYTALLNADGSFNVNIVNAPSTIPENVISKFNESPAITTGIETLIVGYTVPPAKKSKLQRVEFSGTNIGTYNLYKNGVKVGQKHTWFNGPMFGEFSFLGTSEEGPELIAGDILELKCVHSRPLPGDFSGRIQTIELG